MIKKAYKLPSLASYIPDSKKTEPTKPLEESKRQHTPLRSFEQPLYISTPAVVRAGPEIHSPSPSKITSTASIFISGKQKEPPPSSSSSDGQEEENLLPVYKTETETTETIAEVTFRPLPKTVDEAGTMKDETVVAPPVLEDKVTSEPSIEAEHVPPKVTEPPGALLAPKAEPPMDVETFMDIEPPKHAELPKTLDLIQDIETDKLIEEDDVRSVEPPKKDETQEEEIETIKADETGKEIEETVQPLDGTGALETVEHINRNELEEVEPPKQSMPPTSVEPPGQIKRTIQIEPSKLIEVPRPVPEQVEAPKLVEAPSQPLRFEAPEGINPPKTTETPRTQVEPQDYAEPARVDPSAPTGIQRKAAPPSKLQIKREVVGFIGKNKPVGVQDPSAKKIDLPPGQGKTETKSATTAKDKERQDPTSPPSPTARIRNDPGSPKSPTSRIRRLGIQVVDGPLSPKSTRRAAEMKPGMSKPEEKQEFGKRFGIAAKSLTATTIPGKAGTSLGDVSTIRTKKHVSGDNIHYNEDRDEKDEDDGEPLVFRVRKHDAKSALKALKAVQLPNSPETQRRERPWSGDASDFFRGHGPGERSFYKGRDKPKERPKSEVIYEGMVASNKERTPVKRAFSLYEQNYKRDPEPSKTASLPTQKTGSKLANQQSFTTRGKRPVSWGGLETCRKPGDSKPGSLSSTPRDSTSSISSLREKFMTSSDSMSSSRSSLSSRESSVSSLRDRFMSPPPVEESKSRLRVRVVSPPPNAGSGRRRSSDAVSDICDRFMSPPPDNHDNDTRIRSPDAERVARIRNQFASPTPSEEETKVDNKVIAPDPAKMASIRKRFMSPPPVNEEEPKNKLGGGKTSKLKERLFSPPPQEAGPSTATKLRQRIFSSSSKTKSSAASKNQPTSPTSPRDLPDVVSEEKPPGDVVVICCCAMALWDIEFIPSLTHVTSNFQPLHLTELSLKRLY